MKKWSFKTLFGRGGDLVGPFSGAQTESSVVHKGVYRHNIPHVRQTYPPLADIASDDLSSEAIEEKNNKALPSAELSELNDVDAGEQTAPTIVALLAPAASGQDSSTQEVIDQQIPSTTKSYIFVANVELSHFVSLAPPETTVLGIEQVTSDKVHLIDATDHRFELESTPHLCVGLFAVYASNIEILNAAHALLESWSVCKIPPPILVAEKTTGVVFSRILSAALVNRLATYAAHLDQLSNEQSLLRKSHDEIAESLSSVENFLNAASLQPCNMTFESAPSASPTYTAENTIAITQTLPVATPGLSIIQIHIPDQGLDHAASGGMNVELRTLEDCETLQTWNIPPEDMHPGWLNLVLDKGLGSLPRTLELIIERQQDSGWLPALTLGEFQPLLSFRARLKDSVSPNFEACSRSLAVRTWAGLPGIKPPIDATSASGSHPATKVADVVIPFTVFQSVIPVANEWRPDFAPVAFEPDAHGLLCCPPPSGGVTWAELPEFTIGRLPCRLSVRANVIHPEAPTVEFAFAFATRLNVAEIISQIEQDQDLSPTGDLFFSGWQCAAHLKPALLSIFVPGKPGESGKLIFGTRVADGSGDDSPRSCFTDLRKTILSLDQLQSMAPTEPWATEIDKIIEQTRILKGTPVPFAMMEAVENVLDRKHLAAGYSDAVSLVRHDSQRRAIFCHPPLLGVTLARMNAAHINEPFLLLAHAHVANEKCEIVQFCMVVSLLDKEDVIFRLQSEDSEISDSQYVTTGWKSAYYDRDILLDLDTTPLAEGKSAIFLATRMDSSAKSNSCAWAYFKDIYIKTLDGQHNEIN